MHEDSPSQASTAIGPSDQELLHDYAAHGNSGAFESLVQRHLQLVYSAALRQTGQHASAQDVSQAVFIILARKAASLRRETVLAGWLFRTVRYAALDARKIERRRQAREQQAAQVQLTDSIEEPEIPWERLAPLLDEAMAGLRAQDRNAILLRFFEKKSYAEIGVSLGGNENSARVRVVRALEKLRGFFRRRGVAVSAVALSGALLSNAVQAVPPGVGVALTESGSGSATVATLIRAVLRRFFWRRAFRVGASIALLLFLAGGTMVVIQQRQARRTAELAEAAGAVREAIVAVDRAFMSGDTNGFVALIHFRNPAEEQFRPVLAEYIRAEALFRQEMRRNLRSQTRPFDATFGELCVGQPPVTVSFIGSDRAATNMMKYPFHLVKVSGAWKWDLFGGLSSELRDQRMTILARKTQVLDSLAQQIHDREATNATEILQALAR